MCNLNQDSGLGKWIDKSTSFIHKNTVGGRVAQEIKKQVHGEEFVENGGYMASLYSNYQGEKQKKRADIMAQAPAFGTPEYAKWYEQNQKTLLG